MANSVFRSDPPSIDGLEPDARVGEVVSEVDELDEGRLDVDTVVDGGGLADAVAALSRSRPRESACSPSDIRLEGLIAAGPAF